MPPPPNFYRKYLHWRVNGNHLTYFPSVPFAWPHSLPAPLFPSLFRPNLFGDESKDPHKITHSCGGWWWVDRFLSRNLFVESGPDACLGLVSFRGTSGSVDITAPCDLCLATSCFTFDSILEISSHVFEFKFLRERIWSIFRANKNFLDLNFVYFWSMWLPVFEKGKEIKQPPKAAYILDCSLILILCELSISWLKTYGLNFPENMNGFKN